MVPDSVAAVIAFLLFLAPGTVWQLQRSRYRPSVKETTLIEASRIVLASLVASSVAAIILAVPAWLPLYDAQRARAAGPSSDASLDVAMVGAVVATSGVACGLVLIVAVCRWPGDAPINEGRVWARAFVDWRKADADLPMALIELVDGTTWRGQLAAFDADPEDDQRNIALQQPLKRKRPGDPEFKDRPNEWFTVILPESQIKSIQVGYPKRPPLSNPDSSPR